MDWITGISPCGPIGYSAVLTVMNQTTQQVRILPRVLGEGDMSSEATAKLFFEAIVRFYGLLNKMFHDGHPHFTSGFWRDFWKLLGSRAVFSSAYRP